VGWWTGYHRDVARPLVTAAATPAANARRNAGKAHGFGDVPISMPAVPGTVTVMVLSSPGARRTRVVPHLPTAITSTSYTPARTFHVLRRLREVQPRRTPQPHLGDVDVDGLPTVVHGG